MNYDLLIYRDMTDYTEAILSVGDRADALGEPDLYVTAIGPAIHDSKGMTVVLKADHRPDEAIQALLDK